MDNPRLLLFIALSVVMLLLFQAWQADYGGRGAGGGAPAPAAGPGAAGVPAGGAAGPAADVPQAAPRAPVPAPAGTGAPVPGVRALPSTGRVRVETDTLVVEIDTTGGDVRRVDLPLYTVSVDDPTPLRLMDDAGRVYVAQDGFAMAAGAGPNHTSVYRAEADHYRLAGDTDTLEVPLVWEQDGVRVTKRFIFHRGRYDIDIVYTVENGGGSPWQGSFYRQLQRGHDPALEAKGFVRTYTGVAIYTPEEHYQKIDYGDIEEQDLQRSGVRGGWVAMLQHYFVGAWVPPQDAVHAFYTRFLQGRYYVGVKSPLAEIAPGARREFGSTLYVGPKLQDQLAALAEGLDLVVDYGILTVIAKPLFWALKLFHNLTGNWGWAIVLLTLVIKLAFYKLSETSYRSMARMRAVQPKLAALKERYGDDRQRMQQALMELYKKEKINPLGGCLPVLVQIPVFIALYWVLLESVELRQAPWILWIRDLSQKDPYYVLPILMGLTMFLSQRLNPAPPDPLQAKIMSFLPVIFTFFFLFFPSGLVLYWVVNQSLSLLQQWYITRHVVGTVPKKA